MIFNNGFHCIYWILLYFRYLLHGNHVKPSHVQLVGSPDVYGQFAAKMISLRPIVCVAAENLYLERVIYNPITDSPDGNTIGSSWFKKLLPSNPFNSNVIDITYISMESSYFIELSSARKAIEECAKACRCWSNNYDHCTVSKDVVTNGNHSYIQRNETTINRLVSHKKRMSCVHLNTKTGVFIKVLLEKLSRMLSQSPKVNLLLTKLISRLCHYPHPLLTSFLLHHNITLLPAVPDLPLVSVTPDRIVCLLHTLAILYAVFMISLMTNNIQSISATPEKRSGSQNKD